MIYFVQSGEGGPIKIGHARNVEKRMGLLQTGNPVKLNVMATIDGSVEKEQELHTKFHKDRIFLEWFSPSKELLSFIASIQGNEVQAPGKQKVIKGSLVVTVSKDVADAVKQLARDQGRTVSSVVDEAIGEVLSLMGLI